MRWLHTLDPEDLRELEGNFYPEEPEEDEGETEN